MAEKTGTVAPGDPPLIDPTLLTTQQLVRESTALRDEMKAGFVSMRELFDARIVEQERSDLLRYQIIVTRLDAMDKASSLRQAGADRLPTDIDEKIAALREITDEKFASVATQFRERDVRTESTAKDSKVAVDAALQAAKEAVGEQNRSSALAINKSEMATTKQIDQMGLLIQTGAKGIDDKFADLKDRLTRIEGNGEGANKTITGNQSSNSLMIAGIGVVVAVLAIAAAVAMAFVRPH